MPHICIKRSNASYIVDEFGAFMDSQNSGIVFFRCDAIPDGEMWVVGKQGGADCWEGSLG